MTNCVLTGLGCLTRDFTFRYNIWVICGEDGYPYHLDIYCQTSAENYTFGLGGRAMTDLLTNIDENDVNNGELLFFGNYYFIYDLVKYPLERKLFGGKVLSERTAQMVLTK